MPRRLFKTAEFVHNVVEGRAATCSTASRAPVLLAPPGMNDVTPVGFAATEGPSAMLRRRRNPFWLVLGLGWWSAQPASSAV